MMQIITGVTASGKTAYALEKALQTSSYIINADAVQLYKDLPILTASPREQKNILHQGFGVLEPFEEANVASWYNTTQNILKQWGENALLVGGSGFYIQAFLNGGLTRVPNIDPDLKKSVRAMEMTEVYTLLEHHDPKIFAHLHRHDTARLKRALEVVLQTGKSIKYFHQDVIPPSHGGGPSIQVIEWDKASLCERIKQRASLMLKEGAIEEVKDLQRRYPHLKTMPIAKVIGVHDIVDYLDGKSTFDKMQEQIILKTLQYAKRQRTFFRKITRKFPVEILYGHDFTVPP